jgi:hypothetical protein
MVAVWVEVFVVFVSHKVQLDDVHIVGSHG